MTTTSDETGAALLASPVRRAIVDTLSKTPAQLGFTPPDGSPSGSRAALTAAELSAHLELHVTTARFHLDQLVGAGILESAFVRHGVGRPRKVYAVAPGSLDPAARTESLHLLSELLTLAFGQQGEHGALTPAEAGERWAREHVSSEDHDGPARTPGAWLSRLGQMLDVLQEWGYTPELSTSDGGRTAQVRLEHCPFLDLAHTNPAVVCGIHRGLIQGALAQLGETDTEVSLEPFVGPTLCHAHVTTLTPFTPTHQEHRS